ncbi:MAG: DUF1987 domain-containing protein [Candidatus Omnitrophica bacterium]|jgi:hypothetical protein|nr:DUF1987 domain-containing protein [Candidatus Omnitrophota bacterium]
MFIKREDKKRNVFLPVFDYLDNIITITGRSNPEDAIETWIPLLNEIKIRIEKYNKLTINFKLEAFNTASSMYFNNIFSELEKYNNNEIIVNWYYDPYDEDMEYFGEIYQERFKLNFNLIKI